MEVGMTIKEAAEKWVDSFDAIQQSMIAKLMKYDPDEWKEVTMPSEGDIVYVYDEMTKGEVIAHDKASNMFKIKLSNDKLINVSDKDFEVEYEYLLPVWGTMWSFHDTCDIRWLENGNGLETMSECGFRIFESEEVGHFFCIDGAGYDFMEAHWIPLYKARGLQWHT